MCSSQHAKIILRKPQEKDTRKEINEKFWFSRHGRNIFDLVAEDIVSRRSHNMWESSWCCGDAFKQLRLQLASCTYTPSIFNFIVFSRNETLHETAFCSLLYTQWHSASMMRGINDFLHLKIFPRFGNDVSNNKVENNWWFCIIRSELCYLQSKWGFAE